MVSREGREKQLYTADGARVVAGAVVLNAARDRVLLISSEAHPEKWVLPKGGAELDETLEESAQRETWEEAGAVGELTRKLGTFADAKLRNGHATEFHFYEMRLTELADAWPERHKRRRMWARYADARRALLDNKRPQLAEALEESSIARE